MLSKLDLNYLELFKKKYVKGCPICGGKDSFCSCWKKYNLEIKKVSAGIPPKYRGYTLDDFTHPQLKQQKGIVTNIINSFDDIRLSGKSLYFYGSSGTAKTMSAILILVEAINRGYKVKYYDSLQSVVSSLKQAWGENDTTSLYNDIVFSDLLVIDNIGTENIVNDNVKQEVLNIFKQRSYNCLPTIFVSPVSIKGIPLTLDKDIVELFSNNDMLCIEFKGFDYRKKILGAM